MLLTALFCGLLPIAAVAKPGVASAANTVLWQLGSVNDSASEFSNYATANPENVTVPSDWSTRTSWNFMSKGLKGNANPTMAISFNLGSLPANGVELSLKVLDAYKTTPQMAVFSNDVMAGLIQIAGVGGTTSPYPYKKIYRLYIPKELLQTGTNVLKLQTARCLWCSSSEDAYNWWNWDYLKLESLGSPATEPIHGRYTHLGTTIMQDGFFYNDDVTLHLPYILKWLGIAYSGNVNRVALWSDVGIQSGALAYLQKLRDYNMQVVGDNLATGTASVDGSGALDASSKATLNNYFSTYGNLIQYYEVDNEPGLFNRSKAVVKAVASYVRTIKPSAVQIVSPGWAYWPTYAASGYCANQVAGQPNRCGDPDGWERDPAQRLEVENLTDLTNGHSYGTSNVDDQGGSFTENLETFGGSSDGLPRQMLVTETGTDDGQTDFSIVGSSEPHASAFDRIMRGNIGYADHIMQHAAFFDSGFAMFESNFNWSNHDPATTAVHPGVSGEDDRVQSFRRLALAYATHGAPLTYTYLNKSTIAGKKVYFRAVDTSTLAPLPGSGGTSDKILLNFVNFESTAQTMNVRVTMPASGIYEGEAIGAGTTFAAAKTTIAGLNASPTLDFNVTLGAGESKQYILSRQSATSIPAAPAKLWAQAGGGSVKLNWTERDGAVSYTVKRSLTSGSGYTAIASGLTGSAYTDTSVTNGTTYYYVITASNSKGTSGNSAQAAATPSSTLVYEAEEMSIGGGAAVSSDAAASGGKKVGQMQNSGAYVSATVDGGAGGATALKIAYAQGDSSTNTKSLFVNGTDVGQLSFTSTGGWGTYGELTTTVNLNAGSNTIMIKQDTGDSGGVDLDKVTLIVNSAGGGGTGSIIREYWTGVSGDTIGNIPLSTTPSGTSALTSLEGPTNWGDNYGDRMRGYITPTATGAYTFRIAGDDYSELWLSTDDNPANKVKIAYIEGWTDPYQWNKYSTQQSSAISLTAGHRYYVEVLHKEGTGGDNISVAWTGPGISTPTVVAGSFLSPYYSPSTSLHYGFVGGAGDWTPYGGTWAVNSGSDYTVTSGSGNKSLVQSATFTDGAITMDMSVGAGGDAGFVFRVSNPSVGVNAYNGYYAGVSSSGAVMLGKVSGGVYTSLGSGSATVSGWVHMRVEASGSLIKVYVGNMTTPVITATDSTFATGTLGLRANGAAASFNNFYAGV